MSSRIPVSCLAAAAVLLLAGCGHRGITPVRTHFNKGAYHYSKGDHDAALSEYRLALEEDAGDWRARFNLAEVLEAQATRLELAAEPGLAEELRREAEEHYLRLLADDPGHLRSAVNLAARERQQGDAAAAESRLRTTILAHPRSALPRVALAVHLLRVGDPASRDEAIALLEEALRRDPANTDANMLLGHAYAAMASSAGSAEDPNRELLDRAREAYRQGLEHHPSDLAMLLALARLEGTAGKPGDAEHYLRRALYVNPELPNAHRMLSEVMEAQGELEGATFHLWRARQLEDEQAPELAAEEYRRRLLDLYRRLAERERAGSPPP